MKGGKENLKHGGGGSAHGGGAARPPPQTGGSARPPPQTGGSARSQPQSKPRSSRWDKEKHKEKEKDHDQDKDSKKIPPPSGEDSKKIAAAEVAATSSENPRRRSIEEAGTSQNPNPRLGFVNNPNPNPLPDQTLQWRMPPVPQIGFEIFEKRSITMPDGAIRSYYALPENNSEPAAAFSGNPNPSPNPAFENLNFQNPNPYGRENPQFSLPENPSAREAAEIERFYGGPYGAGSIPREPYFSPEVGREREFFSRPEEYGREMREMEAEEFYRREREKRAEFSRMDEENLRQNRAGMSRSSFFGSPHEASASGLGIPRDDMYERWDSPGLRRKAEEDHDYQRPRKFQKQSDGFDERRHAMSSERRSRDNDVQRAEDSEEFRKQVQKAFLRFSKVVNENPEKCKKYQDNGRAGHVHCIVCGWQSKNFMDTHSLIMHAYDAENPALRTEHLGLYKALCVLMGWSYALPPDVDKSYQSLTSSEAVANKEDLILWPPMVIIHNAYSGKKKDGIGNREMDEQLKELGFTGGKAKALYGKDGHHKGTLVIKFAPSAFGLQEADRLFKYFEVNKHGRKDWLRVQASTTNQENDDNNPDLIEVDKKTKLDKRVLYGYIGTAGDLDQLDFDLRKKALVKSRREINATADDVTRVA